MVKAMRHLANGTLAMHRMDCPPVRRKRARGSPESEQRQVLIEEGWTRADKERKERGEKKVHEQGEGPGNAGQAERGELDERNFDTRKYDR